MLWLSFNNFQNIKKDVVGILHLFLFLLHVYQALCHVINYYVSKVHTASTFRVYCIFPQCDYPKHLQKQINIIMHHNTSEMLMLVFFQSNIFQRKRQPTWFNHWVTSLKVVGSILVGGHWDCFLWLNPSGPTIDLDSTQPRIKTNTRTIFCW